jgi:phosphatidylserine decarboxylase
VTKRALIARLASQEDLNFLLTNRIPRRLATSFIGWFSRIEQPLVRDLSFAAWKLFSDLDLRDARKSHFASVHDCFTRELRAGARPVANDPEILVSPCDAIVGACGAIEGEDLLQIKGQTYTLQDLLGDADLVRAFAGGRYITLRLTAGMYHRFHAPHDCRVVSVTHIGGDVWNVNPPALRRVDRLFCKNERAILRLRLAADGRPFALVPVAAILVAGIRLRFLDLAVASRRRGRTDFPCDVALKKGEEMGWFEHGSTIVALAPDGFSLCANVAPGTVIRMGQPLMRLPSVRT